MISTTVYILNIHLNTLKLCFIFLDRRIPDCTLREALTYFFDITTPPERKFLSSLASLATSQSDVCALNELAGVSAIWFKSNKKFNLTRSFD
jgi:hypothetical protein